MKSGFTLMELLIVMSIIGALMAVAAPTGVNALAQAKAVNVAANFRTLHQAVEQMVLLETNPPRTGDILDYLYRNNYVSVKPNGFTITYDAGSLAYIIKYTAGDVSPVRVKSVYGAVELEGNEIVLRVPVR